jgi:hypothetical protein
MSNILILVFTLFTLIACKDNHQNTLTNQATAKQQTDTTIDDNKVKATDFNFFSDSVLHGQKEILEYYFTKYSSDTCNALTYDKNETIKNFEGLYKLGNIHNQISTSVFVLNPLNYCAFDNEKDADGQAYYFTDTTLPRLQTDSYCCHPSNIFLVGDINEDGISEIGEYYSSCSSHYKSLILFSLKNHEWKEVGNCIYDLNYMNNGKPYSSFVKKTSKNKFEMLEITNLTNDKTKVGKPNWIKFSM